MADVFVSYKKEERAMAERVVAALQAAGYSVWWDNDLTPRASWDAEIEREISAARAVLVLWSEKSASEVSFVRREAGYAQDHRKLVPAKIEGCTLPLRFRDVQTADLTRWNGVDPDDREWRRVLGWIGALMPGAARAAEPPPGPRPAATADYSVPGTSAPAHGATLAFLFFAALLLSISRIGFFQYSFTVMQTLGLSDGQLGLLTAAASLPGILGALVSGVLLRNLQAGRGLVTAGLFFCALGGLATAGAGSFAQVAGAQALAGLGIGLFLPAAIVLAGQSVPQRWRALGIGLVGTALALAVLAAGAGMQAVADWRLGLAIWSGGALAAALVSLAFLRRPVRAEDSQPAGRGGGALALVWFACALQVTAASAALWLPQHVVMSTGASIREVMPVLAGTPTIIGGVLILILGALAGLGQASATRATGLLLIVAAASAGLLAAASLLPGPEPMMLAAFLAIAVSASWFGVGYAALHRLAGNPGLPTAGVVMAGFVATLAVPAVNGMIAGQTGSFGGAILAAAGACLLGALLLLGAWQQTRGPDA